MRRSVPLAVSAALLAGCGDAGSPILVGASDAPCAPRDAADLSRGCGSTFEAEPSVAVTADGTVAAAFIASGEGALHVGATFSSDGGGSFDPVQRVDAPGLRWGADPVLAPTRDGGAALAFVGYRPGGERGSWDMRVFVARAAAGDRAFGAPVDVTGFAHPSLVDKPWIVETPRRTLLVTYSFGLGALTGLAAARRPEGEPWGRVVVAAGPDEPGVPTLAYPCVSNESGRVYVAYFEQVPGQGARIALRTSDDDGASFSEARVVSLASEGSVALDDPACVARGDDVWVLYGLTDAPAGEEAGEVEHVASLTRIRAARSRDGGRTFSDRLDAQDPAAGARFLHPALVLEPTGALDLTYYAAPADQGALDADPRGTFRLARMARGAARLAPSVALGGPIVLTGARASARWLGDYTGLAHASGAAYVAWTDNGGGTSHATFARVPLGAGDGTAP